MIDSLRRKREWLGLPGATIVAAILLFAFSVAPLRAQEIWRNTPVVSELWLGGAPVPIDSSAMPAVVISPSGLTYIAFSMRGGEWRYYTKDLPSYFGVFSGFSPIYRPGEGGTHNAGPANLLAVDSASTLHYITSRAGTDSCLQYADNAIRDTILTSFSYLEKIGAESCGKTLGGASTAVDAAGRLHLLATIDNTIVYFRREGGNWSQGVPLSDPSLLSSSPSLAVSPLGEVYGTFLSRSGAQDASVTINYVHGFGGLFDPPSSLGKRNGPGKDGVAPIVLDPNGVAHVAFVDQSSGGPAAIRYRNNIGGMWNASEDVVRDTRYLFGDLSLAADRYGAMHIVARYALNAQDSMPDGELLYTTNADGTWSAPANITANNVEDGAANEGNGFIALRDTMLAAVYTTVNPKGGESVALAKRLLNFRPVLTIVADTVNLGVLIAQGGPGGTGVEVDTTIRVYNGGAKRYEPLRLRDVVVGDGSFGSASLKSVDAPGEIPGGESKDLPFTFAVPTPGAFSLRLVFSSNGGTDTVVVMGTLRDPLQPVATLRLDTNRAYVGTPVPLTCRATPALESLHGITSISARLLFNPTSLFPERVLGPGGMPIPFSYDGKGMLSVVIGGVGGPALQGEKLFTVEFKGLVTGKEDNPVELQVESIPGLFDPLVESGLIHLDGCNVGIDPVRKAGFAGRIAPNPVQDRLTFRYIAPQDVGVSVRLVDLLGTSHMEHDLPSGTGDVQDASLDLRTLASGLYLVRLRVGERVVTDMMIKE